METTEAGTSTDPQKKYAINILAWDVGILCYFSEAAATVVNQSGKDIWGTGACNSNKVDSLPFKELSYSFSDITTNNTPKPKH